MLSFANSVGRLLELRATNPLTVAQMMQGVKDLTAILQKNPATMVCCADFRTLGVLSEDVTQIIVATMRNDNPRIERSAYMIPKASQTAGLQWDRMVREGLNPNRRLHRDLLETYAWLDEILNPAERNRMRSFYAEGASA